MLIARADLTLISVSAHCRVNQKQTIGATFYNIKQKRQTQPKNRKKCLTPVLEPFKVHLYLNSCLAFMHENNVVKSNLENSPRRINQMVNISKQKPFRHNANYQPMCLAYGKCINFIFNAN